MSTLHEARLEAASFAECNHLRPGRRAAEQEAGRGTGSRARNSGKGLPFSSAWFAARWAFAPGGAEVTFSGANDLRAPLSQGWLRLSHRAVDPARSLPWRPWHPHQAADPARPGQAYPAAVELWPTCVVLPAGYRLALSVAGRDFARAQGTDGFYGSGPFAHNDPADRPPARTAGITRVHTGPRTPSSLRLPVIG